MGGKSGLNKAYTEYLSNTKEISHLKNVHRSTCEEPNIFEACMCGEMKIQEV